MIAANARHGLRAAFTGPVNVFRARDQACERRKSLESRRVPPDRGAAAAEKVTKDISRHTLFY
jgi:hypothetical protein